MISKWFGVSGSALAIVVLLFVACPNPIATTSGGSLSIHLTNNINSRTLLPALDMSAASFTVNGAGPAGATFSQTSTGGPVTVNGLAFGTWSVTVNALDAAGTVIGSGQATVSVHTGQTTTVAISVVPLVGNGSLSLTVNWTASQVENASILATLTPPSGAATPLSFVVTGNQATFSSTTIPAGYQTLSLQLLDNGVPTMGAVEVARIVAGQETSGTYTFTNVNRPGGTVQVNVTPAMADPIPVSIGGVGATMGVGSSVTTTASVGDGTGNAVFVWYLNGVTAGMGSSLTFGSTLAVGYYRLDVTAYMADGTRAGSATATFQVTAAGGSAGRYMYVVDSDETSVSAYSFGAGGLPTRLSAPSFATDLTRYGIAATPNGSFLYITAANGFSGSAYAIGRNGLLAPLSPPSFTTGAIPVGMAITANGSFLYVANAADGTVSGYGIGSDGILTPLSTPAFTAGSGPCNIAISANGPFLYVTNSNGNTVSAFSIGQDGLLTALSIPAFPTGAEPYAVAITPNGSFLYVTNAVDNTVSGYSIGSDGLLTPLSIPTFATGRLPREIRVAPNGSFLYVTNFLDGTVSAYAIGSSGRLTPLSTPAFAAGANPFGIAFTPDGSFLYVTNAKSGVVTDSTVQAFAIGSGGLLTFLGTAPTGYSPHGIVVVP